MKYLSQLFALLLVTGTAYMVVGGVVESHHGYAWFTWPGVELERGLNLAGVASNVQAAMSPRIGYTGLAIQQAYEHFDQQSPAVQQWLVTLRQAERVGLVAGLCLGVLLMVLLVALSRWQRHLANTRARRELARKTAAMPFTQTRSQQISLGRVPLPHKAETRGILLPGVPGAGKTQAVLSLMKAARERGSNTIVALDRGGELTKVLYQPGDLIHCPLDKRDIGWSLQAEVENDMDRDTLGELLFPLHGDGSPGDFFHEAAAVIFKTVLGECADADNGTLWRTISIKKELIATLRGTAAEQYLDAREWGGIYGNLMNTLQWLKYLPPSVGRNGASIRRFVRESDINPGRAIWGVIPKQFASTLKPMSALLVGLVAHEALSLPPSDSRRIWLATDELGNLPMLSNFSVVLTEGRKHGLGPLGGIQNIAQLRKIYGRDGAQELISCFQTWLIFRQGDAESAEAMSRHIGDREVREWHQSEGSSTGEGRNTSNRGRSEHVRVKRSVLARELQELPDLHGYLCLSPYPPAYVDVPLVELPVVAAPFEPLPPPAAAQAQTAPVAAPPALDLGALAPEEEIEH